MRPIRWYGPSLVLLLTTLLVMIVGPGLMRQIAHAQTETRISLVKNSLDTDQALADLSDAFSRVAEAVEPSVVHISIKMKARQHPRLRRFFEMPNSRADRDDYQQYNQPKEIGNGSGWVYDREGHIITNNHVVEKSDEIIVRFSDGSERIATIVGTDPKTDVAVLKIDNGAPLYPATIADRPVSQGEIVFAFGSPLRFAFSMSQGIVSAKGRHIGILENTPVRGFENFIQTDAAINRGNSGGPLTNIQGQVVGMNTAMAASPTGDYSGLGFSIPVDMVVNVVDQIIESGSVSRGYLGIYIGDLDKDMARSFGFEGDGVLVVEATEPNSPAAKAGLLPDDIVTHINEQQVRDPNELRTLVADFAPGTKVGVTLFRDGETLNFEVKLGRLPGETSRLVRQMPEYEPEEQPDAEGVDILNRLGIGDVEEFTEELADRIGLPFEAGVIIGRIRRGSIAASQGIKRGTVISKVMGASVETVDKLIAALLDHDADLPIRLRIKDWLPQTERFRRRSVAMTIPKANGN